ncbi:pentatricopeptide repeat-containing protein At2g33680-like [Magnolia sinica]|uniref:pentatricopeptide repeat-containing protein At2g33680-like n=1 Tax=Magnolia sinica TaxID=86752 RepID=UPI002659CAC2|nr:pentatricopeptide repeat-containing protein At2g33680-like [Magnolia sinica]
MEVLTSKASPFFPFSRNLPTKPSFQPNLTPFPPTPSITTRNNLLFSYSKSNSLDQTLNLFHHLPHRDTITWNTVISACTRHARPDTALRLFVNMLLISCDGQRPDVLTFRSVLKACHETDRLLSALQIHGYMIKLYGLSSPDLILNTVLVGLYCEFGWMGMARDVFDRMPVRDVVAFAALMVGYNEAGRYEEALRIFQKIVESGCLMVNEFVFTCALRASAALCSLFDGEQIHAWAVKAMVESDVFVGTALIDMYSKCNRMECAKTAFEEVTGPNVASWNALMAGNLAGDEVMQTFSRMRMSDASPDHLTFATVLRACKNVSVCSVQQIHGLVMKKMGAEMDVFVGGALFERYMDHGCVHDARRAFDAIYSKDITAFNQAIQGYVWNGHRAEAVSLFQEAIRMGRQPNEATLTSLLMRIGGLDQGKQLHGLAIKFGFCGSSDCCRGASIASSLVTMYAEFHCLDDAIRLFDQTQFPDLVLWTSLISGFSQNGESEMALELYILMVSEGFVSPPNHYTFSSLLQSCANLAAMEEGKQIHAQIIKSGFDVEFDLFVSSGLVDMYAKCGNVMEVRRLFDKMPERDLASWNAMITGLAQHGFAEKAVGTFQELLDLPNIVPNHITFTAVLSACSHGGLVEEGYHYFKLIGEPTIDHYACLIDLVGRAGRLEEARNLIQEMPLNPNEHIWSSLLAASAVHENVEMGEYAAKKLMQLNPKDPGTYVVLSNIYAAAGRWACVRRIRRLMKDQGVRKKPGLSWLRVDGRTHVFHAEKEAA